jgi:hypothetical protein
VVVTGVVAGLEPDWDWDWDDTEDRTVAAAEETQVVLEKEQEVMMSTTSMVVLVNCTNEIMLGEMMYHCLDRRSGICRLRREGRG